MKTKYWRWMLITAVTLAAVFSVGVWVGNNAPQEPGIHPVSIQDERAVADLILARKLSGPRFFNAPANAKLEEDGLWIREFEARSQLPRVVAARKLGPEGARALEQLIDALTEHHPSRMIGGTRINLLRLNLSLDALK
jgi:hypothetical protein